MKLTPSKFDEQLKDGRLAVSFIGMSNTGKTFWAKRLEKIGFQRWSCDDEIECRLGNELKHLGYHGIEEVAAWMGQPYEERSPANQQKYLDHEIASMKEVLKEVQKAPRNWAIDTTGSVIYTGDEIAQKLQELTLRVFIEATAEMKELMFKKFLEHPKPVLWGNQFRPMQGETGEETLRRCYPQLLEFRTARYRAWADVIIPHEHLDGGITGHALLNRIRQYL